MSSWWTTSAAQPGKTPSDGGVKPESAVRDGKEKERIKRWGKRKGEQNNHGWLSCGGKIKSDIHRCKTQKSTSVASRPAGIAAVDLYFIVNTYLAIFHGHAEVMERMLTPTLTHDG